MIVPNAMEVLIRTVIHDVKAEYDLSDLVSHKYCVSAGYLNIRIPYILIPPSDVHTTLFPSFHQRHLQLATQRMPERQRDRIANLAVHLSPPLSDMIIKI